MWSGGGESGLGNVFDSVPPFRELLTSLDNILCLKQTDVWSVTIRRRANWLRICSYARLWQETARFFMTGCFEYPVSLLISLDLEAMWTCPKPHKSSVSDEWNAGELACITALPYGFLWKKYVTIFLQKSDFGFKLKVIQKEITRELDLQLK